MIDLELTALFISSLLFLIGKCRSSSGKYKSFFDIGLAGSLIDLGIYLLRIYYFSLPSILNTLDFAIYYSYFTILFYLIWSNSTKVKDARVELIGILLASITIMTSCLYVVTISELFLQIALFVFSLFGLIYSFFYGVEQFGRSGVQRIIGVLGSIILVLAMLLYPSFIVDQRIFFTSLILFYLGWFTIIIGILLGPDQ